MAVGNVGRKAPGTGVRGVAAPTIGGETHRMSDSVTHPAPRAINIAESLIRRRYERGWSNFQDVYKALVDSWQVYDAMKTPPVLIEEGGQA